MSRALSPRGQLALTSFDEPDSALTIRSGREVAALAEALYLRMFVMALGGMMMMCGLVVVAALVRTQNADYVRTAALAIGFALLAGLALRVPRTVYFAMRRRPVLSLAAPMLALLGLIIDGVGYSPLSYTAAVSTAYPAFACGRRWALAAATLISVGALTAATLSSGWEALNWVGQGTVGYFVWALVIAGLAESFARLVMRLPQAQTPPPRATPGEGRQPCRRSAALRARPIRPSRGEGTLARAHPEHHALDGSTAAGRGSAGRRAAGRADRPAARNRHVDGLSIRGPRAGANRRLIGQRARCARDPRGPRAREHPQAGGGFAPGSLTGAGSALAAPVPAQGPTGSPTITSFRTRDTAWGRSRFARPCR